MTDLSNFATALAKAENQPQFTYESLYIFADQLIGAKLFTLTAIDNRRQMARRVFSNLPEAYPLLGTKPMPDDMWTQQVIGRHETFVANNIDAIANVFFDYELIKSLGCESVINIPIVVAGKVLGTINCLHQANHYSPNHVALSEQLKLLGVAAFLLNNSRSSLGDTNE
ncbi:MAG: GAF domain-containing protein [Rhizobiales bacterium]|nr:GAF domain-containing protein [Hyphomicrobiales bacterium]NRB15500.1 GAF domain-containing protein [Hyphomicrobiales bacterium]